MTTASDILAYVGRAAREQLGRDPTAEELAAGCAAVAASASAGYLRLPPVKPAREPKEPPKVVA